MTENYDWIKPYRKIAEKLLDFRDNRQVLLSDLEDIYDEISLKYPFVDKGEPLTDIDPFTVLATFNRGITDDNRIKIIQRIIERWNIDSKVPVNFTGIPLVNNMSAWFITSADRRGTHDIENLWKLFESTINFTNQPENESLKNEFISLFDTAVNQRGVSFKITFGLFWISPNEMLNLDTQTRRYLLKHNLIDVVDTKQRPNGERYLRICKSVKEEMVNPPINAGSFPELSYLAFIDSDSEIILEDDDEYESVLEASYQYLWVNFNPRLRGIQDYSELLNKTIEYSWGKNGQPTVRRVSATSKLKIGDKVLLVDIEPNSGIFAKGYVSSTPHKPQNDFYKHKYPGNDVFDIKVTEVFDKIPRTVISELPAFENVRLKSLLKGVSISPLSENQYRELVEYISEDPVERIEQAEQLNIERPFRLNKLYFENKEHIERQIHTALKQGKNIIFTGPPGTGKSKLASEVAEFYQAEFKMVTASSHWSTYETIGGYHPNKENQLEFNPGLFLSCVKDSLTGDNLNQWLIIDELNRADIDKAFGSFFSVVTGDSVTLPFEGDNSQPIELVPIAEEDTVAPKEHVYVYPHDWRLIATMNTADKSSLFELSYAFMRRFAFINIGVPKTISENLVDNYLGAWSISSYSYSKELAAIWSIINQYRKLGPAIIKDLAAYTSEEENFTDAILLFVMPQLEGVLIDSIHKFIETLKEQLPDQIDSNRLYDFAYDFFGDAE